MSTKDDIAKYPLYLYLDGDLIKISRPPTGILDPHHFIRTQWIRNNPEKFKEIEHLQKIIFLPRQCHAELHAKHSKFKERWGLDIQELLYK